MGGVSVFSIEQDTRDAHLESAIWDVGGMAPPAEEIAQGQQQCPNAVFTLILQCSAVSGSILADSGDVDSSYFVSTIQKLLSKSLVDARVRKTHLRC